MTECGSRITSDEAISGMAGLRRPYAPRNDGVKNQETPAA